MNLNVEDLSSERGSTTVYECVGCQLLSPPSETSFTLISDRYGWRLHRARDFRSGEMKFEWRCPDCWRAFSEGLRSR